MDLNSKNILTARIDDTNRQKAHNSNESEKMIGASFGIITDNRDPMGLYRVKANLLEVSELYETDWIPVCNSFISTTNQLHNSIPKIGDKVLVVFEKGDLNRPIVVGCVSQKSNKESSQPSQFALKQTRFDRIQRESSAEENFYDCSGDNIIVIGNSRNRIKIHTKSGNTVTFEHNGRGTEKIVLGTSTKIEIDTSQDIVSISIPKKLTIKASNLELEATENMNLKCGSTLTINGSLIRIN